MAKKKAPVEKTAYTLAIELKEVRDEMNVLKQTESAIAEELKKHMKAGEEQDLYEFTESTSLKVKDAAKVMEWAQKFAPRAIVVDTKAARAVFLSDLKGEYGTPEAAGFAFKTIEQLREVKQNRDVAESGYDIA